MDEKTRSLESVKRQREVARSLPEQAPVNGDYVLTAG
jgi:hypothetical protein